MNWQTLQLKSINHLFTENDKSAFRPTSTPGDFVCEDNYRAISGDRK